MRTTIEIKDNYRAKLLELAARRGEKGFSKIVEEALSLYFHNLQSSQDTQKQALAMKGSLNPKEIQQLYQTTEQLRKSWR